MSEAATTSNGPDNVQIPPTIEDAVETKQKLFLDDDSSFSEDSIRNEDVVPEPDNSTSNVGSRLRESKPQSYLEDIYDEHEFSESSVNAKSDLEGNDDEQHVNTSMVSRDANGNFKNTYVDIDVEEDDDEDENFIDPDYEGGKEPKRVSNDSSEWNFKNLIKKEYLERVPTQYVPRKWTSPSALLIKSLMDMLEGCAALAIKESFTKYSDEVERVLEMGSHDKDKYMSKMKVKKFKMMKDLITKIGNELNKATIPTRRSDKDLNMKYVIQKRLYLQKKLTGELEQAEKVESLLNASKDELEELFNRNEMITQTNKTKLMEAINEGRMNPALNKAFENTFGIKDTDVINGSDNNTNITANTHFSQFENDKQDFNIEFGDEQRVDTVIDNIRLSRQNSDTDSAQTATPQPTSQETEI